MIHWSIVQQRQSVFRTSAAALLAMTTTSIQAAETEFATAGYLSQLIGALVLVVGLIVALAWLLRRMPGGNRQSRQLIEILAVRPVGTRDRLMLVQVGEEQLLIAHGPSGMYRLHRLRQNVVIDPVQPAEGEFANLFGQSLKSETDR